MEIKISNHRYPPNLGTLSMPAPLISGTPLGEDPQYFRPTFKCDCGRLLYDGGLCQPVYCMCGHWLKRSEDDSIAKFKKEPPEKCKSKGFGELLNLESVTFGVFEDSLTDHYKNSNGVDYPKLIDCIIKPYFLMRSRCVEEGLILKYREVKFKVLTCYPRQGFVVKESRLHLYLTLSNAPIAQVEIIPLPPHTISEDLFDSVFLPYFISGEVHLHTNQHVFIYGLECIVSKTEPSDGFVVPNVTEFNYCEYPIPSITKVSFVPYIEDIPSGLSRLPERKLIESVFDCYLMPYLKGWKRVLRAGMIIEIGGIDFKVREIEPDGGLSDDQTLVFYSGKAISRRRNPVSPRENEQLRELVQNLEALWFEKKQNTAKLPVFVMKSLPQDSDQKVCIICITDFEKGAKVTTFPCCNTYSGHIFHKTCSQKWLIRNQTCPICKTPV